jgi:hypothetical protein
LLILRYRVTQMKFGSGGGSRASLVKQAAVIVRACLRFYLPADHPARKLARQFPATGKSKKIMQRILSAATLSMGLLVASATWAQPDSDRESQEVDAISEITVRADRVANTRPAGSYASPVTALRFDPLAEIQARGLAEGQSDVTVRGGIFENTGFKLGAVTIMDPQTGHYAAGLGIDPALLSAPAILKGIDNAIEGFNSTIGTIVYDIPGLEDGGTIVLGAGSDATNFQAARFAQTVLSAVGNELGASFSFARSGGDGSVPNGDHRFSRYNLQLQRSNVDEQSDLLLSYEDKFYGWPGAYTGFASLAEIDDTQTTLLLANHRVEVDRGWLELGAYYRRLIDDYDFDRTTVESGAPGSFEHETRNVAIGLRGQRRTARVSWRYAAQFTSDKLVRSTDLINGRFDDRKYAKVTVVPSFTFELDDDRELTLRAGATVDYSSRDSNAVSPLVGLVYGDITKDGKTEYSLEYAATSQLPGYTALNSNPSGLFGGNPDLGRERAKQLAVSVMREAGNWRGRATVFSRRDDDLVDWTYATAVPFSRQANPVDIEVIGFEAFFTVRWSGVDLAAGYTCLDKTEDYGTAPVDASFYALNFARHRATVALKYRFARNLELRVDNEYRRQQENPLRTGDDSTYVASLSLLWASSRLDGLTASLIVDNLTDSDYQPFPGTPAAGRQLSLIASYGW